MRTLHNYIEASKKRREDGEAGFSLIELIVVVAILGILVAIAIPVFGSIQATAAQNALKTSAANAATQIAAAYATAPTTATSVKNLNDNGNITFTIDASDTTSGVTITNAAAATAGAVTFGTTVNISNLCVQAAKNGVITQKAGPGC